MNIRDQKGVVTLPMILLTTLFISSAILLLMLVARWHQKVALQLRLDQCVELTALDVQKRETEIEAINHRMEAARAVLMAVPFPPVQAALKAALAAEVVHGNLLLADWILRQTRWLLQNGCGSWSDHAMPLAAIGWRNEPPDSVGPRPFHWSGGNREIYIEVKNESRRSTARVFAEGSNWSAAWACARTGSDFL